MRDLVGSSFELLADTSYRDGIMSIEAAYDTFMHVSDLEVRFDELNANNDNTGVMQEFKEKISDFRSHKFELEKEYRLFLNPTKV